MWKTLRKTVILFFILTFSVVQTITIYPTKSYAQSVLNLPTPGAMVPISVFYQPPLLIGFTINPSNPLLMDFIVDPGDDNLEGKPLEKETEKLIKYFLTSLTVPEDEMWVNLSPYEENRIVPKGLGQTEMGRDLLAQDYMLKQLTSTLMNPEDQLGSEFWKRVYSKAQKEYGTSEIPINTFNKIWIVPEFANVHVEGQSVFVVNSHLKVLLEEDYLALESNLNSTKHGLGNSNKDDIEILSGVSSEVIRNVLIPEIEKEINKGKTFSNLRQIFNSMILAAWYKQNLKNSFLGMVYADQNKTQGIDLEDKEINQKIYNQYVESFNKGVFDFIREDYDIATQQIIPRKYFSGGISGELAEVIGNQPFDPSTLSRTKTAKTRLDGKGGNASTLFKGSPAKLLETVRDNDDLIGKLMGSGGVTVVEVVPYRKKSEGDDTYHIDTVRKEFEILREVGVLKKISGRYFFMDLIKNKIVEDGNVEILGQIANIEYQVGTRGETRPLYRYTIPQDKRPAVRERIISVVKPTEELAVTMQEVLDYRKEVRERFVDFSKKASTAFNPTLTDSQEVSTRINKSIGNNDSVFYNLRLNAISGIRQRHEEVQSIVHEVLGKGADILNTHLDEIHITIANPDVAPKEAITLTLEELADEIREDVRGVRPFRIQLVGPHLMESGVVIMEYTTSAPEFLHLRKKAEERLKQRKSGNVLSDGNKAFVPNIFHSSVSRIRNPRISQAKLQRLFERLNEYRESMSNIDFDVREITVVYTNESNMRFIRSETISLDDNVRLSTAGIFDDEQLAMYKDRYDREYDSFVASNESDDYSEEKIDALTDEIIDNSQRRHKDEKKAYVQVVEGNQAAFKSTTVGHIVGKMSEAGKKVVIIKRDWFLRGGIERRGRHLADLSVREISLNDYSNEIFRNDKFEAEVLKKLNDFNEGFEEQLILELSGLFDRNHGLDETHTERIVIDRETTVIIEGVGMLKREWEKYYDGTLMLLVKPSTSLERRLSRGAVANTADLSNIHWRINVPSFLEFLQEDLAKPDLIITTDLAMLGNTPGGIDLNPNILKLQINDNGIQFDIPIDFIDVQNIKVDGFVPVIIQIIPTTNLQLLLGSPSNRNEKKLSRLP